MKLIKLTVLIIGFIIGQYETTNAELLTSLENNKNSSVMLNSKDNKTVIELDKDITVNTGLNLDKALAQLNGTEASYIPRIRKVTHVDNDSLAVKQMRTLEANATISNYTITTTNTTPKQLSMILSEGGGVVMGLQLPEKNNTGTKDDGVDQQNITEKVVLESKPSISNDINKIDNNPQADSKNVVAMPNQQSDKSNKAIKINPNNTSPITTTTVTDAKVVKNNTTKALNAITTATPFVLNENNITYSTKITPNKNITALNTTKSTTTTTTSTTTTTTTTTTPKPKKPTITYSVPDFPDLEKDNPELNSLLQSSASSSDGPYAQPSQEYTGSSFQRGRDFILPIVSMIFIIPLVIGIMITSYRRFRDCWSTRHYRRMDFLVDGMYND